MSSLLNLSAGSVLWLVIAVAVSIAEKDWKPAVYLGLCPVLVGLALAALV